MAAARAIMIVFDLICQDQHRFEGWFASGEDFTSQQSRGLLNCPVCGVVHVAKLPAAKIRKHAEPGLPASTSPASPVGERAKGDPSGISAIVDFLLAHSEDVGQHFAEEARRIHYQEAPQRNIRGTASRTEAEDLREEGIQVFSLPVPPQDRWN